MAGTGGKGNPISYDDIFKIQDDSAIKSIIANIRQIDTEYNKLSKSIQEQSQLMQESFNRVARDVQTMSRGLSIASEEDRKQLVALATSAQDLQRRYADLKSTQSSYNQAQKEAGNAAKDLKDKVKALEAEYVLLTNAGGDNKKRLAEITIEAKNLKDAQDKLKTSIKSTTIEQGNQANSVDGLKARIKSLTDQYNALDPTLVGNQRKLNLLQNQITTLKAEQDKLSGSLKTSVNANKDYERSVDGIEQKLQQLAAEYRSLNPRFAENQTRMLNLAAQAKQLRAEQNSLISTYQGTTTANGYVIGSYKALEQETSELTKKLKLLPGAFSGTNQEAERLRSQIRANNDQLRSFDQTLGINTRNVGNYRDALGGGANFLRSFATSLGGAFVAFQSLQAAAGFLVQTNLEVSDSLSNVQRTANLTADEADRLAESFKKIDTRTSLKGLLDIATIGGQLGISKDQLVGFTKSVDQLAVALSGEITGGAEQIAKSLGKINLVFRTQEKEATDAETSLNKTGSAILRLGQAGLATGDFLQDFTLRVAGTANAANIGLPQILAYGAVLEETGNTAEVAGSSFNRLIGSLATKKEQFFAIARLADSNLTLKEFINLINTDAPKALELFFNGLNKGGSNLVQFKQLLADLKLTQSQQANAITALAKSQDIIALRTKQAVQAYNEGTLAAEQFRIKNENLAGAVAKLGNAIANGITESGFSRSIAKFINSLVDGKSNIETLTLAYKDQKAEADRLNDALDPLVRRYDALKREAKENGGEAKLNKDKQQELRDIIRQIGDIMPGVVTQFDKYGNALDINRGKVDQLTKAQKELLLAQSRGLIDKANKDFDEQEQPKAIIQASQNPKSPLYDPKRASELKDAYSQALGRQYQDAKSIQSVGGQLTKPQADIIEYFEQTKKKAAEAANATRAATQAQLQAIKESVTESGEAYGGFGETVNSLKTKLKELQAQLGVEQDVKKAGELADSIKQVKQRIAELSGTAKAPKEVKTEIELLERAVKKLTNTVESQALKGKVNGQTLDALTAATIKLKTAQETGRLAIAASLDPLNRLNEQTAIYKSQLERAVGSGKDATGIIKNLTAANKELEQVQGRVKIALAQTQGTTEGLSAKIEFLNTQIKRQAETGKINSDTLGQLTMTTKQLEEVQDRYKLALLQATDPLAYLNAQVDILKRTLTEQAASGDLSKNSIDAYAAALASATEAQDKFNQAARLDPRDASGSYTRTQKVRNSVTNSIDRDINKVGAKADSGDKDAIAKVRELEQQKLAVQLDSLNSQQELYKNDAERFDEIETQKTAIYRAQEKLRTDATKEETELRNQLIQEGFVALGTIGTGYFDSLKQGYENSLNDLQKQQEYEINLVGNNTVAKQKINDEYNKKQKEIKRKQAIADKAQALFNIALNTAIGVTAALASLPPNVPLSIAVGIIGALQFAFAAAKPLPAFAKGTKFAPEGYAIVGEKGREAIESTDGKIRLSGGNAHVTYLNRGDKVHTSDSPETKYYTAAIQDFNSGKNVNSSMYAYSTSALNIARNKTEYENMQLRRAISGQVSKSDLTGAFKEAVADIPVQNLVMDINGYRVYEITRNAKVENMNKRNSMGGNG